MMVCFGVKVLATRWQIRPERLWRTFRSHCSSCLKLQLSLKPNNNFLLLKKKHALWKMHRKLQKSSEERKKSQFMGKDFLHQTS